MNFDRAFVVAHYLAMVAALAAVVLLTSACGKTQDSVPKATPQLPSGPGTLAVQLNDAWNQAFPSESAQLSDARYFNPPAEVFVVQGAALCWDGVNFNPCNGSSKALHARIHVGAAQCEYIANDNSQLVLSLLGCSGLPIDGLLPAGTTITLENYDAPGQLLEAHFNLTQ
jgi:hypothetical protein